MATEDNLHQRVKVLVEAGKIYYLQPTAHMARRLEDESRRWRVTCPDMPPRPWGVGPNEDVASMLAEAQHQVYGVDIATEWVTTHSKQEYEELIHACSWRRGPGSPYQVAATDVAAWLEARRSSKVATPSDMDPRDLHRQVTLWRYLTPHASMREVQQMKWVEAGDLGVRVPLTGRDLVRYAIRLSAARGMTRRHRSVWDPDVRHDEAVRLPGPVGTAAIALAIVGVPWSAARESAAHPVSPDATGAVVIDSRGYLFHRIDGRIVPSILIDHPERQTLDEIRGETNAELRRLRIERYAGADATPTQGWRRYLAAVDPRVIDDRRNDVEVTREVLLDDGLGRERVLLCTCRTGRLFALPVPVETETCAAAQNWLSGANQHIGGIAIPPMNVIGRS